MSQEPRSLLQPVTQEVRAQARQLVRTARHATMASIVPDTGAPLASRVLVAPDITGDPVILISDLSGHSQSLKNDARASVMFGQPGKGDPLAHARITVNGLAEEIGKEHADYERIRFRFLLRQPKAGLYMDFPDFRFFRINLSDASLNGGFGKAYALVRDDLTETVADDIVAAQKRVVEHMNDDHADAIERIVVHAGGEAGDWLIGSIDRFGSDFVRGDKVFRVEFPSEITTGKDYHMAFVGMARATAGHS
ncbi:HugZ family protein [Aureimonas fodinaquatilis]|uniref:HugZ family protein n=1 Tax=Aureimonas fodinaquatilis TaxID=2565783 RepID=A0A5B0E3I7_9HYPH|nr:DUF2470 domain-containing protein [Aureimonas fodinaquatilis]KAA0972330.1 HugZ family protein [Aureimonas fodinaquatilis]